MKKAPVNLVLLKCQATETLSGQIIQEHVLLLLHMKVLQITWHT